MGICCFPAKYVTLRSKNKNWFAQNQDDMSEWSDMSTHDCCFSERKKNPACWSSTKRRSS